MKSEYSEVLSSLYKADSQEYNGLVLKIGGLYRKEGKIDFLDALTESFLQNPLSLKSQRIIELFNLFPRRYYELLLQQIPKDPSQMGSPLEFLKIGIIYLMNHQYSEADGFFNKAALYEEYSIYAKYLLSNNARMQHQYEKSRKILDGLLKEDPKNGLFLHRLGLIEQDLKHFEIAKQIFKQMLNLEPHQDYALLQLAWLDVEQHQYQDAINKLDEALEIDPFDPYIYSELGDVQSILGNAELAIENYQKALNLNPYLGHVWKNLSITFIEKKQFIQAEGLIGRLMDLDPAKIDPYLVYAWLYEARDEYKKAISYLQQGLQYNPSSADLYLEIAKCYENLNDDRQEFWALQQALRHDSLHINVHLALGYYYLNKDDLDEAIKHFQQSLKQDSMNISSLNGLAISLYQKEQNLDDSNKLLQKALLIDRSNVMTLMNLGQLYFQETKYRESEGYLQQMISIDPQSSTAYHLLGLIAWNFHSNENDALSFLEKALTLDGENLAIAADLCDFYMHQQNNPKKAKAVVQKFINQNPTDRKSVV